MPITSIEQNIVFQKDDNNRVSFVSKLLQLDEGTSKDANRVFFGTRIVTTTSTLLPYYYTAPANFLNFFSVALYIENKGDQAIEILNEGETKIFPIYPGDFAFIPNHDISTRLNLKWKTNTGQSLALLACLQRVQ